MHFIFIFVNCGSHLGRSLARRNVRLGQMWPNQQYVRVKRPSHRFYIMSKSKSMLESQGVLHRLWKQFYNVFCDSEGSFVEFERITKVIWEYLSQSFVRVSELWIRYNNFLTESLFYKLGAWSLKDIHGNWSDLTKYVPKLLDWKCTV